MTQQANKFDVKLRFLVNADLVAVAALFNDYAERQHWHPLDIQIYVNTQRGAVGKVLADTQGKVYGALIYHLSTERCDVPWLVIQPEYRRQGLGTLVIQELLHRTRTTSQRPICITVAERNLGGQLFLKRLGFRCDPSRTEHEPDQDIYSFIYRHQKHALVQ